jgi:hypothetical protein
VIRGCNELVSDIRFNDAGIHRKFHKPQHQNPQTRVTG